MKQLGALIVLIAVLSLPGPASAADEQLPCPKANAGIDDDGGSAINCDYTSAQGSPGNALTEIEIWHRWCGYLIDTGRQATYVDGAIGVIDYQSGTLDAAAVDRHNLDPTGTYGRYIVQCHHPVIGSSGIGADNIYTITDPVPLVDLRAIAKARVDIDDPVIETNPSFTDRFTVVNLKTWLWVDQAYWDEEKRERESSGFVTVEVWAEPILMEWSFNDPDNSYDDCNHPGEPWTRSSTDTDCFVKFTKSSAGRTNDAFEGTTDVSWQFSWSVNGADQGPFDDLFVATSNFELQVGEIQAVES